MKANVSDCLIIQSLTAWCCLLPQKHLSVLRRCGCCWPAHMQTGTGKTAVEWRSNCCRGHTSGERPHRQRKDQSEIFFKKKDNKTVTGSNKKVRIMAQHWAQNYRSFAWFTDLKKIPNHFIFHSAKVPLLFLIDEPLKFIHICLSLKLLQDKISRATKTTARPLRTYYTIHDDYFIWWYKA